MNCQEIEDCDIAELYLLDRLTDPERDEFEKHYFDCESCFSQLQAGVMVQAELRRQPMARSQTGGALLRRMWAWTPALVAAALLFSVGIWWYSARAHRPSQQASSAPARPNPEVAGGQSQLPSPATPSLEELARVEPPPYSAVVLRGAEDEAQETFRAAMQYYVKGDYAHAIPGLRTAVKVSPRTARFNFYLGASYLLTGQTNLAIESFRRTISLADPSYSEPAHFYLAKAYLRRKEVSLAEDELQMTIQLHGSKETEAEEILRQLRR
jgi:tetratricopeptide (TPR) repeat protein